MRLSISELLSIFLLVKKGTSKNIAYGKRSRKVNYIETKHWLPLFLRMKVQILETAKNIYFINQIYRKGD